MFFLAPWALLWLGSLPVLIWLWRFAATRRQVRVPSLIPFERLLRRPPRRHAHLVVNLLFWLQLAALTALALALAQPRFWARRAPVTLVILDTSASMEARRRGASAFDQAKRALRKRLSRTRSRTEWCIMTTAPVASLTPRPTTDRTALARAVESLRANHLGGNLSTAARVGRALLGVEPDAIVVVTDEAPPEPAGAARLQWVQVGAALPNVALVGLDTSAALCQPATAHIVATVQNFSDEATTATISAHQGRHRVSQATVELAPRARQPVSLALPEGLSGWVELVLAARADGLSVDNRAWIELRQAKSLPLVVQIQQRSLQETVAAWLDACQSVTWSAQPPPKGQPHLLITDQPGGQELPGAAMVWQLPGTSQPALAYWTVPSNHPIAAYVGPVEVVAAPINLSGEAVARGTPAVTALISGREVPVITADEREGARTVTMWFDPSAHRAATPVVLTFFNSLRWLMGHDEAGTTSGPLLVRGVGPGPVRVQRPDGSLETVGSSRGSLRYDAVTLAGLYRFSQGSIKVTKAANFLDPLESNLIDRRSTWHAAASPETPRSAGAVAQRARSVHPLAGGLMTLALVLVLMEWWRYSRRSGPPVVPSPWSVVRSNDRQAKRQARQPVTAAPVTRP